MRRSAGAAHPAHGNEVWFSASGFAWRHRAFVASYDALRESLGAINVTEEQIRLVSRSDRPALLRAIQQSEMQSYEGLRIRLSLAEPGHPPVTGLIQPATVEPFAKTLERVSQAK